MALLDVTEYSELALDSRGNPIQTGMEPALVQQQVTFTGTAAASAAFQESTRYVRVHSDAACRIRFGVSPTAVATDMRLAAGATEYFGVKKGANNATLQVSAITTT